MCVCVCVCVCDFDILLHAPKKRATIASVNVDARQTYDMHLKIKHTRRSHIFTCSITCLLTHSLFQFTHFTHITHNKVAPFFFKAIFQFTHFIHITQTQSPALRARTMLRSSITATWAPQGRLVCARAATS